MEDQKPKPASKDSQSKGSSYQETMKKRVKERKAKIKSKK